MSKAAKIFTILIVLYLVWFTFYLYQTNKKLDSKELIEQIDSLESKSVILQHKNDSIDQVIDTIYITLKENNKRYEENSNVIINNSVDENYMFFTNYINRNKARFDSLYNF